MIYVLWSKGEIVNLGAFQKAKNLQSYRCDCGVDLKPTDLGWYCINCEKIIQNWAHDMDVVGDLHSLILFRERLDRDIDKIINDNHKFKLKNKIVSYYKRLFL